MRGLDYPSERYVRLYTRDTVSWAALGWEAQALYPQILRRVDRAGVLDLGEELLSDALAALFPAWPADLLERASERLIAKGYLGRNEEHNWLFIPDHEEAETAKMTSAQRSREHRARKAAGERLQRLVPDGDVTLQEGDAASQIGTRGDAAGRGGTRGDSDLSQPNPSQPNPESKACPPETRDTVTESFDRLWAEISRIRKETGLRRLIVGKAQCRKIWHSLGKDRPGVGEIVAYVEAGARSNGEEGWARDGGKFCPEMAKIFRNRRWEDGPESFGRLKPRGFDPETMELPPMDPYTKELYRDHARKKAEFDAEERRRKVGSDPTPEELEGLKRAMFGDGA